MAQKSQTIIITGASGFVGRNLLDELKNDYRIFAVARRSQHECNAPFHPNIAWIRADIADRDSISKAFREVATAGGAEIVLHLAAFYEFAGEDHPEYRTTNVDGTRHVLELAREMGIEFFLFASSVAACSFPEEPHYIDETSAPDGIHVYAWSKREGERMVREYSQWFQTCIIRLGAVYSDWCEYPPLYMFLNTWLGESWRSRLLAGKGISAIPYIHIRDVVYFFRRLLASTGELQPNIVLNTCTRGSTTHKRLYQLATRYFFGKSRNPIHIPKFISGLGLYVMYFMGELFRKPPFERPWMWRYIDKRLNVDNAFTSRILNWTPNPRYAIEMRLPFMVERLKSEPYAWQLRNMVALRKVSSRPDFHIYTVLSDSEEQIVPALVDRITSSYSLQRYPNLAQKESSELLWFIKLLYRLMLTSIHMNNKLLIQNYFEISGISRFEAGYSADEIIHLLRELDQIIIELLNERESVRDYRNTFYDFVSMPIEFGIDEIDHQFHTYQQQKSEPVREKAQAVETVEPSARELLEETIWNCLVHRK